jgi:hypothetical protein
MDPFTCVYRLRIEFLHISLQARYSSVGVRL